MRPRCAHAGFVTTPSVLAVVGRQLVPGDKEMMWSVKCHRIMKRERYLMIGKYKVLVYHWRPISLFSSIGIAVRPYEKCFLVFSKV